MEELREEMKLGVSFRSQKKPSFFYGGNTNSTYRNRAQKNLVSSKRPVSSSKQSLRIPESPAQTMEFLCRPWSPCASDFLNILSSNNYLSPVSVIDGTMEHEEQFGDILKEHEQEEVEEALNTSGQRNTIVASKGNNKIVNPPTPIPSVFTLHMDLNNVTRWLKGKSVTSFLRSHREKKKDEVRFHTAKLDAALSLTRLAAAISGFATNGDLKGQDINHRAMPISRNFNEIGAWSPEKGIVVASAAALMTTVCAEIAESLGAKRSQVAGAVRSGLANQTPIDMITLTATAATCLRGAATLKSRALTDSYTIRNQGLLKVGAEICIMMSSGKKEYKCVIIYLKCQQLILSFRKKYLGGVLTTSKEYKVMNVTEDTEECQGCYFLSLITDKGIIRLLFEDQQQSNIWKSTICNLLKIRN